MLDQVEARVLLSDVLVTNTNDSGPHSLRDAILTAQATDHIIFQIPTGDDNNYGWCFCAELASCGRPC
ncbi:MAG: hypothetical protein ABSE84_25940, partial [Isosphaeraceae bacterium]